jgi:hypothetical protein
MPHLAPVRPIAAMLAGLGLALLAALGLAALAAPAAHGQGGGVGVPEPTPDDPCPVDYPGDDAAKSRIGRWMARGAAVRGLPGELPVMAGLAESGLRNLSGSAFSGYFGMHRTLNSGPYRGFKKHPERQLQWFTDTAVLVRQRHVAEGDTEYGRDGAGFGLWIADVERPAQENRSGYQKYLDDAQELIDGSCTPTGWTADTAPPPLRVRSARRQRGALTVRVACPGEGCVAGVSAMIPLPRKPRRAAAHAVTVPVKGRMLLTIRLGRRALRAAPFNTKVEVIAADEAGNPVTVERNVRLIG